MRVLSLWFQLKFVEGCGLLWNFVQHSPEFIEYLLSQEELNVILVGISSYIVQGKEDIKKHGAINLAIFILLSLSSKRAFGLALSSEVTL